MTETELHVLYLYTYEIRLQSTIIVIPNEFKTTVTFYWDYFLLPHMHWLAIENYLNIPHVMMWILACGRPIANARRGGGGGNKIEIMPHQTKIFFADFNHFYCSFFCSLNIA